MSRDPSSVASRAPSEVRRRRTLAIALSLGAHLALLPLLFLAATERPIFSSPSEEIDAVIVSMEPPPAPVPPEIAPTEDPGGSAAPPSDAPKKPAPPIVAPMPRPAPPPPVRTRAARPAHADIETVVANPTPSPTFVGLSDAELGGATVAGSGSGNSAGSGSGAGTGSGAGNGSGGPCDMVRRIQDALRDDANIRQTATEAHRTLGRDRALLMWDGDWLQSPGQAGKGLAGVRQAIALEIAFAPPACRRQTMQGYAVISLGDAPGSPRIALGAAHWRWSDLAVRR